MLTRYNHQFQKKTNLIFYELLDQLDQVLVVVFDYLSFYFVKNNLIDLKNSWKFEIRSFTSS